MGVKRARLERILEEALGAVRAGEAEARVRAVLEDAIRACSTLARDRVDHTDYVLACRSRGMTLAAIGAELGISGERVRLIADVGRRRRERDALAAAEGPITGSSSVDRLDLPPTTAGLLYREGIETIGALARLTDRELCRKPGMGRAGVRTVRRELERVGMGK
jgi:hypothetical protein